MKRVISFILFAVMSLSLFACGVQENTAESTEPATTTAPVTTKAPKVNTVAVITYKLTTQDKEAIQGINAAAKANSYVEGENYNVLRYDTNSSKTLTNACKQAVAKKVDLIFAVGEQAAKYSKKATTDIPIVFLNVEDPIGQKLLKSCETPEGNVTGVCDYNPVFEQIALIAHHYPEDKKVGCVYDAENENAIFAANLASGEAKNLELPFKLYPAKGEDEYEEKAEKALKECDVLYLPASNALKDESVELIKAAGKKKIPVFTNSKIFVKEGCVATVATDYESLGFSAGELGIILLRDLKKISQMPVEYAEEGIVVANKKALKNISLTIDSKEYKKIEYIK